MTEAELDEIAGYCRVAFGKNAWDFNEGVDEMLRQVKVRMFPKRYVCQNCLRVEDGEHQPLCPRCK